MEPIEVVTTAGGILRVADSHQEFVLRQVLLDKVKTLVLQDGLSVQGARVLSVALAKNKTIFWIQIYGKVAEGSLEELEVPGLLQNSTLRRLNFDKCQLGNFSCLSRILSSKSCLSYLEIHHNHEMGDEGVALLSRALEETTASLQALRLYLCGIRSRGALSLARMLTFNTTLRILNLSSNEIGDDGAIALASGLSHNTTLQQLNLPFCGIQERGAIALSAVLDATTTTKSGLERLHLRGNFIAHRGVTALVQALALNVRMVEFTLNVNAVTATDPTLLLRRIRAYLKANRFLKELLHDKKKWCRSLHLWLLLLDLPRICAHPTGARIALLHQFVADHFQLLLEKHDEQKEQELLAE